MYVVLCMLELLLLSNTNLKFWFCSFRIARTVRCHAKEGKAGRNGSELSTQRVYNGARQPNRRDILLVQNSRRKHGDIFQNDRTI